MRRSKSSVTDWIDVNQAANFKTRESNERTDELSIISLKNIRARILDKMLQNSVNHRIFERTLHSLVFRRVCLFECHEILNPPIL